jgi:hypothetical protein
LDADNIRGVNKIMETLRNWGMGFVFIGYSERISVGNTEFFSVCLCCIVLVSKHWWLCWVAVCERTGKWEASPIFWKRTDHWCMFSWSICDKTATLLGVSRATVSKVILAHTNLGKTLVERNSGRNQHWLEIYAVCK